MENKRTLSIGVTINLGNYENLHLEVSNTAETKEAALVLDGFAQNNASAKEAIDKYKERVLDNGKATHSEEQVDTDLDHSLLFEDMEQVPAAELEPVFISASELAITTEIPMPVAPESPVPKHPIQDVPSEEFTGEKCDAPIFKVQRGVSKMFTGKVLCKNALTEHDNLWR